MDSGQAPKPDTHQAAVARDLWSTKAQEWDAWIGADGDRNRQLNSDPVLWSMMGEVDGLRVLDAGCGNGYLCAQLVERGARVVGVDWSVDMVALAHARVGARAELHRDDCRQLDTIADASVDLLVSNYVLMDTPDLDQVIAAFSRVLVAGGRAVIIIVHPCFGVPGGPAWSLEDGARYHWKQPYMTEYAFEERWGPFGSRFVVYHRPLSRYWSCFRAHGFTVSEFAEPTVDPARASPEVVARARATPNSAAFALTKRRTVSR